MGDTTNVAGWADKGAMMNSARFEITGEMLAEFLRLPPGTRIVGVDSDTKAHYDIHVVHVTNGQFPPVPAGAEPPLVQPLYNMVRNETIVFTGWGGLPDDPPAPTLTVRDPRPRSV